MCQGELVITHGAVAPRGPVSVGLAGVGVPDRADTFVGLDHVGDARTSAVEGGGWQRSDGILPDHAASCRHRILRRLGR